MTTLIGREAPDFNRNYPEALARHAPFGPFRAVSQFDPKHDDGDTLWFMVDLGWDLYAMRDVRLLGINAPDYPDKAARDAARDALGAMLPLSMPCLLEVLPDPEKYGRWLAVIFVAAGSTLVCVNVMMLRNGMSVAAWGYAGLLQIAETYGIDTKGLPDAPDAGLRSGASQRP